MKTDDTDDENETEDDGQTSESGSGSGSPPDQKLQHKMCVFRFKLMQFINCIHNHFMTRVSGTLSCNMNYFMVHFLECTQALIQNFSQKDKHSLEGGSLIKGCLSIKYKHVPILL